ncbi:hypothetical protein [Roseiconus lacunae]|uniref:hypothetical protein n=1 Tax=Roseiconus lacunae TaxID=2605694 RepID=UPI0011F28F2A|nr:hypothetical protein [Roseiconus lacunae]
MRVALFTSDGRSKMTFLSLRKPTRAIRPFAVLVLVPTLVAAWPALPSVFAQTVLVQTTATESSPTKDSVPKASLPPSQNPEPDEAFLGDKEPTFFNEPIEDTRNEVAVVTEKPKDDQVHFLGIAQAAVGESPPVAMFRINGQFHTFIAGEHRQGVRLKAIDMIRRSVSIERDGQSLQIDLLSQPIVNEAVSAPSLIRRGANRPTFASPSSRSRAESMIAGPPMVDLPDVELPSLPQGIANDIDRLPELPDIPDLPLDLDEDLDLDL